jgi:aldehyde dehydrogenase (NAD+)
LAAFAIASAKPIGQGDAIDGPELRRYDLEHKFSTANNLGEQAVPQAGFIDGAFVTGEGATLAVQDPSTEEVFEEIPGLSTAQTEQAILSARRTFDSGVWSGLKPEERVAALGAFLEALRRRVPQLTDLVMREAGCPKFGSTMTSQIQMPLKTSADLLTLYLKLPESEENPLPLADRVTAHGMVLQSHRHFTPLGVVAGISAYNFPLMTALMKVIPALVTGNTIVMRPSPLTPLSHLVLGEAAQEAGLPAGVLNVVLESGLEGGQMLSTHGAVDLVSFTGSTAVGAQIMAQAAPTMKRLQLELGGKSAQIFLPDSVAGAAAGALQVCTAHAGQGCSLGTRILVPQESKAEVIAQTRALLDGVKVGRADDPETKLGPVISQGQRARCEHFVEAAIGAGGSVISGGKRPAHLDKGFFFEATALDLPDNANPAAQDEIFGPVVGIIGYDSIDHAIEIANDSKFGLAGYVYGKDRQQALKVGMAIKSGTVNVNGGTVSAYISTGGQRMSGIGRERGVEGLRTFQAQSNITLGA